MYRRILTPLTTAMQSPALPIIAAAAVAAFLVALAVVMAVSATPDVASAFPVTAEAIVGGPYAGGEPYGTPAQ